MAVANQIRQCSGMATVIIQAGNIAVLLAAGMQEQLAVFLRHLLQGLQTVYGKGRADQLNTLHPWGR